MLKEGIISDVSSMWSFPVVIATKYHGKPRFCVGLNKAMNLSGRPIPIQEETYDQLVGWKVLSTLGMLSGYWQIFLTEDF